jgi:hypothetical protein
MTYKALYPHTSWWKDGRALRAGGNVGMLVAAFFVYALPCFLARAFSLSLQPAWGLGNFSFGLCVIGAVLGMVFGRSIVDRRSS